MSEYASIANFIYNAYVVPAFLNGTEKITIRVHEVLRGLESQYGVVAIHRVLGSGKFRASLFLAARGERGTVAAESHLPSEYEFDLKPLLSQRSMRGNPPADQLNIERADENSRSDTAPGGSGANAPAQVTKVTLTE